jgi:hypothetical protein
MGLRRGLCCITAAVVLLAVAGVLGHPSGALWCCGPCAASGLALATQQLFGCAGSYAWLFGLLVLGLQASCVVNVSHISRLQCLWPAGLCMRWCCWLQSCLGLWGAPVGVYLEGVPLSSGQDWPRTGPGADQPRTGLMAQDWARTGPGADQPMGAWRWGH